MDTVIVGSAINTFEKSIFSPETRLNQLIEFTLKSIRKYLPNSFIIVVEDTDITDDIKNEIKKYCNLLLCINNLTKDLPKNKSLRETFAINYAFDFIPENSRHLFKLGGRYNWNERFDLSKFKDDKMGFIYHPPFKMYETCTFFIPNKYIKLIILIYKNMLNDLYTINCLDAENSITKYLNNYEDIIIKFNVYNFGITTRQTNTLEPKDKCVCCF